MMTLSLTFDLRPSSHRRRPRCPLVATHLRTSSDAQPVMTLG
jgi:hypothetical protein